MLGTGVASSLAVMGRFASFLLLLGAASCGSRSALPLADGSPWVQPRDGRPDVPWILPVDQGPDRTRPPDLPRPDTRWTDPHRPPLPGSARCADGWCVIPAGSFSMGSPPWEGCRNWSDTLETQHTVTLTRDFEMSATEVTQGQYQGLMGKNPSAFTGCGVHCPVERVRWYEAVAYCNALSAKNGLPLCYSCTANSTSTSCYTAGAYAGQIYTCPGYRLPTEAEWEYAYRAGTKTAYYSGDNSSCTSTDANAGSIGWYDLNSNKTSHPAAQKKANAWGLYDLAGNAMEWTHDDCVKDLGPAAATNPAPQASSSAKVLKGGAWLSFARQLRAAYRTCGLPQTQSYLTGFRCVRSLNP